MDDTHTTPDDADMGDAESDDEPEANADRRVPMQVVGESPSGGAHYYVREVARGLAYKDQGGARKRWPRRVGAEQAPGMDAAWIEVGAVPL